MRRAIALIAVLVVVGLAGYYFASRGSSPSPGPAPRVRPKVVKVPRVKPDNTDYHLETRTVDVPSNTDPMAHAINTMLAAANDERASATPIPHGVRLLGLKVDGGTATVDFSAAFSGVNKRGDAGESMAQNMLRMALAQFDEVKTMRVLVDGKVFEGEHSGQWTDIPVRDESAHGGERP